MPLLRYGAAGLERDTVDPQVTRRQPSGDLAADASQQPQGATGKWSEIPILSDACNEVAGAFGPRFTLPDDLIELYRNLDNNLPVINGEPSWTLPMPARFVIGQDGIIRYTEVNPDYTQRPEPAELIPAQGA